MKRFSMFRVISGLGMALYLAACTTTPATKGELASVRRSAPPANDSLSEARADAGGGTPLASEERTRSVSADLAEARADPRTLVAHFIDVGQGDATLLEFSCAAVLIDTGGETTAEVAGRDRLRNYLNDFFSRRPDLARTLQLVVLSHPHTDHTDGVQALLDPAAAITILNVVDNGESSKGSGIRGQKALRAFASRTGAGYMGVAVADITTTGGVTNEVIDPVDCRSSGGIDPKIVALWGKVDGGESWKSNANNNSVVVRVDFGSASLLFMGDMEKQGIAAMLDYYSADISAFDVDVLKVSHHGSENGTTNALVDAVTPKVAVIQSGDPNLSHATYSAYSFAHPRLETINRVLSPTTGVSMARPPKPVMVGVRGASSSTHTPPQFTTLTIDRAIYDNGWDGDIKVRITADGDLSVETEF